MAGAPTPSLWLDRGDWGFQFIGFCFTTLALLPTALYAIGRQAGLGAFTSAMLSGFGLAIGVRLVRWWLHVAGRNRPQP